MATHAAHRDSTLGIVAALLPLPITGVSITMQPGFVQAWVDYLRYDQVAAGFVASGEVAGLMAATILFAFVGSRFDVRRSVLTGLALIVLANLASLPLKAGLPFALARILAGFGAGIATSVCFTALANTRNPGRNYGWAIAAVIGYSAVGLGVLPAIFAAGGERALLIAYSLSVGLCFPFLRWLPSGREEGTAEAVAFHLTARDCLPLAAVLLFFVGYTAAWTYMALIGRDAGLDEAAVARTLALSQFAGVAGAGGVAALSGRVRFTLLAIGMLGGGALGIVAFSAPQTAATFFLLNCLFQFAWNGGQPLLLAIIAEYDLSARVLRLAIPLQFIGMAAGPSVAAMLLGAFKLFDMVLLGAALAAGASFVLILPVTRAFPKLGVD